jgi:carbon storage regulator CsrA
MLSLQRNIDEVVVINVDGKRIEVMVCQISGHGAKLGFTADRDVVIMRKELLGRPGGRLATAAGQVK